MAIGHPSYNGIRPIRNWQPSTQSYQANKGRTWERTRGGKEGRADQNLIKQRLLPTATGIHFWMPPLCKELLYYSYFLILYSNKLLPAAHFVSTSSFFEVVRQGTPGFQLKNPPTSPFPLVPSQVYPNWLDNSMFWVVHSWLASFHCMRSGLGPYLGLLSNSWGETWGGVGGVCYIRKRNLMPEEVYCGQTLSE